MCDKDLIDIQGIRYVDTIKSLNEVTNIFEDWICCDKSIIGFYRSYDYLDSSFIFHLKIDMERYVFDCR